MVIKRFIVRKRRLLLLLYGDKALHCQVEALTAASFMVIKRFIVRFRHFILKHLHSKYIDAAASFEAWVTGGSNFHLFSSTQPRNISSSHAESSCSSAPVHGFMFTCSQTISCIR